jgi:hypothetical protein
MGFHWIINGTNPLVIKDGLRYSLDDFPIDVHMPI